MSHKLWIIRINQVMNMDMDPPPPSVFLSSINPRDIFKTCIFASKFSTEHHHMHAHSFFCVRLSARDLREEKRLRNTGKNLKLSMWYFLKRYLFVSSSFFSHCLHDKVRNNFYINSNFWQAGSYTPCSYQSIEVLFS